jgi:hypothetical protein
MPVRSAVGRSRGRPAGPGLGNLAAWCGCAPDRHHMPITDHLGARPVESAHGVRRIARPPTESLAVEHPTRGTDRFAGPLVANARHMPTDEPASRARTRAGGRSVSGDPDPRCCWRRAVEAPGHDRDEPGLRPRPELPSNVPSRARIRSRGPISAPGGPVRRVREVRPRSGGRMLDRLGPRESLRVDIASLDLTCQQRVWDHS